MNDRAKKLLSDVALSGQSITDWCRGSTFSDYKGDRKLRKAVEREFETIGEALNRLSQDDPETAAAISQLSAIIGFRNRIIHGYDTVEDEAVWGVIEGHLPKLLARTNDLLREADE